MEEGALSVLLGMMKTKEATIEEISVALDACGDMHIVDDADSFELVEVLGQGSFGAAELRRVPRSDGASEGSFIVVKRVPLHAEESVFVCLLQVDAPGVADA